LGRDWHGHLPKPAVPEQLQLRAACGITSLVQESCELGRAGERCCYLAAFCKWRGNRACPPRSCRGLMREGTGGGDCTERSLSIVDVVSCKASTSSGVDAMRVLFAILLCNLVMLSFIPLIAIFLLLIRGASYATGREWRTGVTGCFASTSCSTGNC
jgi:hypothetical protein